MFKIVFLSLIFALQMAYSAECSQNNLTSNMCAGKGYCTYYPIGLENQDCGKPWTVPKNWVALDLDCLSNTKTEGTLSCSSGKGKIRVVICGKSNCYKCLCE